ncbi:zinc carboxypeptidase family protein [Rhodopirellula maiorica SM1]|uniref:Zinc carboxypeptidase family protein n=2 Tax=Novipirellula TaxID=2795426 RepID=M5S547_9BACT|nr:zinc carboxypeptidase family protein [Rhodopirellula maiorica SM1]
MSVCLSLFVQDASVWGVEIAPKSTATVDHVPDANVPDANRPDATAIGSMHPVDASLATTTFESLDQAIQIDSDFCGGRLSECFEITPTRFQLVVRPERKPINNSAWYAFRVRSNTERRIKLHLSYQGGTHRYTPRISNDGRVWRDGQHLVSSVHPSGSEVVLQLDVGPKELWVSAQELISNEDTERWTEELAMLPHVNRSVCGRSVQGRPISKLVIGDPQAESPGYVFIMGRLHPPETTGAIGVMRFAEAIAADTELTQRFRRSFHVVVVPNANPDGVDQGRWRCNANSVDLNRDWGLFRQPETQVLRRELLDLKRRGRNSLYLVLDFHSTYEDVFYLTEDVDDAFPKNFTATWLNRFDERLPSYSVNLDKTHNSKRTTSKAWVDRVLNVAAVTYEFGDNTDRDSIAHLSRVSAEEMMRTLLRYRE